MTRLVGQALNRVSEIQEQLDGAIPDGECYLVSEPAVPSGTYLGQKKTLVVI